MNQISRRNKTPMFTWSYAALLFCLLLAAVLVAFYFNVIVPYVVLPADILMWGETDFVGYFIKLRTNTPLYMPPEHSNSSIYTPGAPLLTYGILWALGQTQSIPAMRIVQLVYVGGAALLGTICIGMVRKLAFPGTDTPHRRTWFLFAATVMFLAATSPHVNRNVHCLHNDALALLVSMICFWTLLAYFRDPSWSRLLLMAVAPVLGYFVKQFLLGWAGVMLIALVLKHGRHLVRPIALAAITAAVYGGTVLLCYALWGEDFIFWTFRITGGSRSAITFAGTYNIALVRSVDHTLGAWMEIMIGVVGGWLLIRVSNGRHVVPLWISWMALIVIEALGSGLGWGVLYHFGPGVMIGVIWLFAALPRYWIHRAEGRDEPVTKPPVLAAAARSLAAIIGVITVLVALQVFPTRAIHSPRWWPGRRPSADVYRYISDIEEEFKGVAPERVLLDVGNWVYLPHGVVAKDRAVSLADQPLAGIYENFDVMLERIRAHAYDKILVRDMDSPSFVYDWDLFPRPSGVRRALLDHYQIQKVIPAPKDDPPTIMHGGPITVLVPAYRTHTNLSQDDQP